MANMKCFFYHVTLLPLLLLSFSYDLAQASRQPTATVPLNATIIPNGLGPYNCQRTETPCQFPSSGYTCCQPEDICITSGSLAGTCASISTPATPSCPQAQICIPDPLKAPNTALCCPPETACTPNGCEYRHPHYCPAPSHKNCGVDGRCVKDYQCCPAQCVVDFGYPVGSVSPPLCCAAGGYCTPYGCWYKIGWNCSGKLCGTDGSWTCAQAQCCKKTQACGPQNNSICCADGDVCVNNVVGKCCKPGQIESSQGECCAREMINADGHCCASGTVPAGHGCAAPN